MPGLFAPRLISPTEVRFFLPMAKGMEPLFLVRGEDAPREVEVRRWADNGHIECALTLDRPYVYGERLALVLNGFDPIGIDASLFAESKEFDDLFAYDGPLGICYSKEKTLFRLWAPFASEVNLVLDNKEYPMKRGPRGVWKIAIPGDLEGKSYHYAVTNFGERKLALDPYAKAGLPNGKASLIVDEKKIKKIRSESPTVDDPIIYEGSVRDLTSDPHAPFVHKGKFLGLAESHRGYGLDHIASLGVTHLQLLPLSDFATVDELHPARSYNWGYDPSQYFVPEGSYVVDLANPYGRIDELQTLVKAIHKKKLRLVVDFVFNHVYFAQTSLFEKIVPGYYFRHEKDGTYTNHSWCGNDFASERAMVRRYFVDVVRYWVDVFDIDGIRFDLMGLLDRETMKAIEAVAKAKKKDFLLYGEGWDMAHNEDYATLAQADKLPGIGFFDDQFREVTKKFAAGLGDNEAFLPLFIGKGSNVKGIQSIHYVECHDDDAYRDWLVENAWTLSLKARQDAIRFALALVLLSKGRPFLHAGQELGQTKFGMRNTYKAGDRYNQLRYSLIAKNAKTVGYVRKLAALRNEIKPNEITYKAKEIDKLIRVDAGPYRIYINGTKETLACPLEEERIVLSAPNFRKEGVLPALSLLVTKPVRE